MASGSNSYDESIPSGFAEDVSGLALSGRSYVMSVYRRSDSSKGISARMPLVSAYGKGGRFGRRKSGVVERRDMMQSEKLLVLLAPDLASVENDKTKRHVDQIRGLSKTDAFEIAVMADHVEEGWTDLSRVTLREEGPDDIASVEMVSKDGGRTLVGARMSTSSYFADRFAGKTDLETLRRTLLLIDAFGEAGGRLVVTALPELIAARDMGAGELHLAGIVTPAEAVKLCYAVLRGRQEYLESAGPTNSSHVDSIIFYDSLAKHFLPTLTRSFRHALAPERRQDLRKVADHMQAIIVRFVDALIAADDLGRMYLSEGLHGGGNSVLLAQLYHVHNSLVLYTGALDTLAWVAADVDGIQIDRAKISWKGLLSSKSGSLGSQLQGAGAPVRDAARSIDRRWPDFVIDLRDSFQHRKPMQGMVAEYRDGSGETLFARYCIVNLRSSVTHGLNLPSGMYGIFRDGCIQPHILQHAMVKSLGEIVETVIASLNWKDSSWLESEKLDLRAMQLNDHHGLLAKKQWWWEK